MGFKGYEILEDAIKDINVGKKSAYHYLRNQRIKGAIFESDFVKLTGKMIDNYKKEKGLDDVNGYMIVSENAISFLKRRFGKKVVSTIPVNEMQSVPVNEMQSVPVNEMQSVPVNEIILNEDSKDKEKRLNTIKINKDALMRIGYGELIATEYSLQAVEENTDIVTFARKKATESRLKRIKLKRSMLSKSFKRKGKQLEEAGYKNPYKMACNEFKTRFYKITGFDLTLLDHKKEFPISDFLTEFNLWKVALKVANDYELESVRVNNVSPMPIAADK